MAHPPKRKARKIAVAVFRGKRINYEFDVFPVGAEIRDSPAVFIFSRRATDRLGRGHHAVVCVGETDSIYAEQKRHKRAACVKQNALNSLCVLRESDADTRAQVLDDLMAARSFGCVRNVYTAKISPAPAKAKKAAAAGSSLKRTAAAKPVKAAEKPARRVKKVNKPANEKAGSIKTLSGSAKRSAASPLKPTKTASTAKVKSTAASATAKKTKSQGTPKPATKPIKGNAAKTAKNAKKSKTTGPTRKATAVPPRGRSAAAVPQRSAGKRTVAVSKPKAAAGKKKTKAEERASVAAKQSKTPSGRKRIQSSVDSNRGQHRLSKPKRVVDRSTKGRTVKKPRTRQKAAA